MKNTTLGALAAVVTLAAVLSGCSGLNSLLNRAEAAPRDEPGGQITEAADADVFSLQVGDCFDFAAVSSAADVSSVPTLPCSDPHDAEIFAEAKLTDEQFTSGDAYFEEFCLAEFATFVGTSYDESTLSQSYFSPSPESWATGDDLLQCFVVHPDATFTGTMGGSGL